MSLIPRLLQPTFVLGEGQFGDTGSNQATLDGLRISATVTNAGGAAMPMLDMRVYGMTQDVMNQLSTLGLIATTQRRNSVTLAAGDAENGMATVFSGTIVNGFGDYNASPDVPFRVTAQTGLFDQVSPVLPTSITGTADVATLLSGLATQMGIRFENNGVTAKLSNSYYYGSARVQARQIVEHAGIEWNSMENGVLAIWNPGQSRGGQIPLISVDTGMIGYPSFFSMGITVKTLWNPSIQFGQKIQVQSSLQKSSGTWVVKGLTHDLESMVYDGLWESTIQAASVGLGPIVPT